MATIPYSLEQVESDLATLRGQVDRMSEVLTKNNSTDPPNTPAAGLIHYSAAGQHKYVSSDGGYYNTGRQSLVTTADFPVNSTSNQVITGLSCPVAAGTYRVHGVITWTQGGVSAAQNFRFDGPSASHVRISYFHALYGSGVSNGVGGYTALGSNIASPAFNPTTVIAFCFDGVIVFTAGGTFQVSAGNTINTDTCTANSYSFMDVMPIS